MASPQDTARLARVAIVGRPNVGKSTLFNRLVGRREAIVHDRPGVTRDRLERVCLLETRRVVLEDTGGILPDAEEEIPREVTRQALRAAENADLLVFVIDGRAGVTPLDESIAEVLRPTGARILVVANKIDVSQLENDALEAWSLGLGEPLPVSSEHGLGAGRLVDEIEAQLPAAKKGEDEVAAVGEDIPSPDEELHVAVIGRPNVGKSSLINRLAGDERVTVSAVPGTTRDAIDVALTRDGRRFRLVDTAGIRRRPKVESRDEGIGILMTRRRLARAHVAVVVVDAEQGITSQDQAVVGEALDAGRPILLALNKWDLVEKADERVRELDDQIQRKLAFAGRVPRVRLSALTGQRAFKVLDRLVELVERASRKVSTSELNRFLKNILDAHLSGGGTAPKTFYITQTGTLPPRFVVFCRDPKKATQPFRRFVERRIRESFEMEDVPVRVSFRATNRRERP